MSTRNMQALSIRQPFAELVLQGKKTKEYRSWNTNILNERIYLYASAKGSKREILNDESFFRQRFGIVFHGDSAPDLSYIDLENLPRGFLIGTMMISACDEDEDGGYAWSLADVERLQEAAKAG